MIAARWLVLGIGVAACAAPRPDVAGARAVIDRGDAAFNAHDAAAMGALLDDATYVGANARGPVEVDVGRARAALVAGYARGAARGLSLTRTSLVMRTNDRGDVAWFIAEYVITGPAPDGSGPAQVRLRESGVLIHRAGTWRFGMLDASVPAAATPPPVSERTGSP